jgi:DNA-binding NtrC family response regulator
VRQLHNVIRVAVALLDEGEAEILPAHLPEELFLSDPADEGTREAPASCPESAPAAATTLSLTSDRPGPRRLDQLEVELIERVMREVGGNLSAAARLLGVSRNRLYRKLGRSGNGAGEEG